ncbi:MAG TPA: hypothetical protein VGC53_15500 [Vicinamibacteria bacterium]
MPLAWRLVLVCALLTWVSDAGAIEAEDPSDYVRVLEGDQRDLWGEAVDGLLGEDDNLPVLSVSSVLKRLPALDPMLQARVARALGEDPRHPKTADTLWQLMQGTLQPDAGEAISEPPDRSDAPTDSSPREAILKLVQESVETPKSVGPFEDVQRAARETLLLLLDEGKLSEEWIRRLEGVDEQFGAKAREAFSKLAESGKEERAATAPPPERSVTPLILIASAVLSGIVGALLFVWAFRLLQLSVRVRNRPVSKVSALALRPIALEGEVQPTGAYLRHPVTGEACVYYAGADIDSPNKRFYLEDGSGRVLVDPRRAVLFSDDGVLVAGERVHVAGFADRDSEGNAVIRKDETEPPLYRRIVHRFIKVLFGFGHATSVTRMLFSDPHRCFWIWDDLERRPMGEAKDVVWLAAGSILGGAWMLVFALAVMELIDEGTVTALLQGV